MAKEKEIVSQEDLAELNDSFPTVGSGAKRDVYPRIGMLSKDIVEESGSGKNKKIKILEAAGTFFINKDSGKQETGEDGKVVKVWEKEFFADQNSIDVIIAFHRRQLRIFDQSLNKFISSPVYDSPEQIIPLFLDGRQIAIGNQEQLQAKYPAITEKGKKTSKLKEEKILFVIYEGETYQMTLTTSSKWAFQDYARKVGPATVVTTIGSIEETFGTNTYSKMTFTNKRLINKEELDLVKEAQGKLKDAVESDRVYLENRATIALPSGNSDEDMENLAASTKGIK